LPSQNETRKSAIAYKKNSTILMQASRGFFMTTQQLIVIRR